MTHKKDISSKGDKLPQDQLDGLLREWHEQNRQRATANRDDLLARLRQEVIDDANAAVAGTIGKTSSGRHARRPVSIPGTTVIRRIVMNPLTPLAACLAIIVSVVGMMFNAANTRPTGPERSIRVTEVTQVAWVPEGGRLDALDAEGQLIGACPLQHTDVDVQISGIFSRVTLTQRYANPYPDKIEAVYTFPMSQDAAVDRMKMIIGDRVVLGEVKEREEARQIYEAAKAANRVASLLEQERPNIFTQSVANIEPGAEILIEISYVELVDENDGLYSFDFPMVVGPRYIPGYPAQGDEPMLPEFCRQRRGVVLLGPARLTPTEAGDATVHGHLDENRLTALLSSANAIQPPTERADQRTIWSRFQAEYADGSLEIGELYTDGTGVLNGRWFYCRIEDRNDGAGGGFSPDTDQVPDASRITPMPVDPRIPGNRAGHDITVSVTIDTGGPGIVNIDAPLHKVTRHNMAGRSDGLSSRARIELAGGSEIPNRDFVLNWRQTADTVEEAVFAHNGRHGGFVSVMVQPPARVTDAQAMPKELIFVLDTSGSMSGEPIEKAKQVMTRAIGTLRPNDTFNIITFAGHTSILWPNPRPGTPDNIAAARRFVDSHQGGGGTEMMKAINAALEQHPVREQQWLTIAELANLPADGRQVIVREHFTLDTVGIIEEGRQSFQLPAGEGVNVDLEVANWIIKTGLIHPEQGLDVTFTGRWVTEQGRRIFKVDRAEWGETAPQTPIRIVAFMTDGYVGNDMAIIDAINRNVGTTRVFSFGIGNSVNRYLLDNMARAGRGEVEYVLLDGSESDADEKVRRFSERILTPVLTNVEIEFSGQAKVVDVVAAESFTQPQPSASNPNRYVLPDLFDVKPIIVHARYNGSGPGSVIVRGMTANGRYERTIPLAFVPAGSGAEHDVIDTLWARSKVEHLINVDLNAVQQGNPDPAIREQIVNLGTTFNLVTQYTSFVAVDKARITIDGEPRLVNVPIELPDGTNWEGFFGPASDTSRVAELQAPFAIPDQRHDEILGASLGSGVAGREWSEIAPEGELADEDGVADSSLGLPARQRKVESERLAYDRLDSVASVSHSRGRVGQTTGVAPTSAPSVNLVQLHRQPSDGPASGATRWNVGNEFQPATNTAVITRELVNTRSATVGGGGGHGAAATWVLGERVQSSLTDLVQEETAVYKVAGTAPQQQVRRDAAGVAIANIVLQPTATEGVEPIILVGGQQGGAGSACDLYALFATTDGAPADVFWADFGVPQTADLVQPSDVYGKAMAAYTDQLEIRSSLESHRLTHTFDGVQFIDVLSFIAAATNIRFEVNWASLEPLGIEPQTTVSYIATDEPVSEVLDSVLKNLGAEQDNTPVWRPMSGMVAVAARHQLVDPSLTMVYQLHLIEDVERRQSLQKAIEAGGDEATGPFADVSIRPVEGRLVVSAPADGHEVIRRSIESAGHDAASTQPMTDHLTLETSVDVALVEAMNEAGVLPQELSGLTPAEAYGAMASPVVTAQIITLIESLAQEQGIEHLVPVINLWHALVPVSTPALQQLHETVNAATLSEQDQLAVLERIAGNAEAYLAELRRLADLRRRQAVLAARLDPDLFEIIRRRWNESGADAEAPSIIEESRLVTVAVSRFDESLLEALRGAGLGVVDEVGSANVIVGRIVSADLEDLALVDGVQRIEPTRFELDLP